VSLIAYALVLERPRVSFASVSTAGARPEVNPLSQSVEPFASRLRRWWGAWLACAVALVLAGDAAAQGTGNKDRQPPPGDVSTMACNPAIGCTAGDPPTMWFVPSIGGTTQTTSPISVTIHWCDDGGLTGSSRSVKLNGQSISSTYSGSGYTGCWQHATSVVSLTPAQWSNLLEVSIRDNFSQTGSRSTSFTYDPRRVNVTPPNGSETKVWGATHTSTFTIQNLAGEPRTFNLTTICSGAITGCSSAGQVTVPVSGITVPVTYHTGALNDTGTVKLRAASTANSVDIDTGSVKVTASLKATTVSFQANVNDNQQLGLCADACFAATYAHSTVAYFSLGAARNVTLRHHEDRITLRPIASADVILAAGATNPDSIKFEVRVNGAAVPFVNGETVLRFVSGQSVLVPGETRPIRVAGQFDAGTYATGMHPMQIIVTALYPGYLETATYDTKLMVINLRNPNLQHPDILPVPGWTVEGIQRLIVQPDGTILIVEGDGSGVYFSCTSYASPCAGPTGDFTKLSSTGIPGTDTYTRAYPDSTKVLFNNLGQMTRVINRLGLYTDVTYNVSGRIERIYDPFMTYDQHSKRTSIDFWYGASEFTIAGPGPNGAAAESRRATTVTYNASNRVTAIRDPDGVSTAFAYDANGRLETVTDRRGGVTRYVYDPTSWKVIRVDLPEIVVDAGGGATTPATPSITYRPWHHVGIPTTATAGAPATPPRADSIASVVTDAGNHVTRSTVDRWGQPMSSVDMLGNATTITRSGMFATTVTDALGRVDSLSYTGHLVTRVRRYGQQPTVFTRNAFGGVLTVRTTGQANLDFEYDAQGRRTAQVLGGTYRTTYHPDWRGRDTLIVDPANHPTKIHYDTIFGNPDSVQKAAGQWRSIRFDAYGRDSTLRASHQPAVVTRLYDVFNRDSVVYDGVNPQPTRYRYDNLFLTRVTDPKGQTYRFDVNALGWITKAYDPADTVTWSRYQQYTYDRDGLVKSVRNRRGQLTQMQYDSLHRLRVRLDSTLPVDSFFYAPNGRWVVGKNAHSTDSIRVGNNGSDTIVTVIAGRQFKRVHSAGGGALIDTTTITTDVPGVSFPLRRYYWSAARGSLDSIQIGSEATKFSYNSELLRSTTRWPSGLQENVFHTSTHDVYRRSFGAATVDSLMRRTYSYDSLGRILSEQRPVKAATESEVRDYAYDGVGHLRRYQWSETASPCTPKDGYGCEPNPGQVFQLLGLEYDPARNLSRQIDTTSGNAVTGTSYETPNKLTAWGNLTYGYDLDGNRVLRRNNVSGVETTYGWSATNRLMSVQSGSTILEYDYNAFGQLVRRRSNGVVDRNFIWDEGQLLAEFNGTASSKIAEYAYNPGVDRPLALITRASGSVVRYYHQDERGNVIGLTNGSSVAQHNVYNPWGQLEAQIDMLPDTSRLGWKALVREGGITQLYYVRARWYDPESRRFMSEDPIGLAGGLNLYGMADNDPVNKSDPTGLDAEPGMCQYTTVGGVLDSWDFSGCGGGGPSVSYIAVLLMAMEEPSYPSLSVPGMGPHGGGGGGARTGPGCGNGLNVVQCGIVVGGILHLLQSSDKECRNYGTEASSMLNGRIRYVNAGFSGHWNDGVIELGRHAFGVNNVVTAGKLHAAMGGTLTHELAHKRNPHKPGDPPHVYGDKIYQAGWGCAGFEYTR
jgi:RHS repeat-associated protein